MRKNLKHCSVSAEYNCITQHVLYHIAHQLQHDSVVVQCALSPSPDFSFYQMRFNCFYHINKGFFKFGCLWLVTGLIVKMNTVSTALQTNAEYIVRSIVILPFVLYWNIEGTQLFQK